MEVTEELEEKIFNIICKDDVSAFKLLLAQGLPLHHRFKGDWISEHPVIKNNNHPVIYAQSVAKVVVINNAKKIATVMFDLPGIEDRFESRAPIYYAAEYGSADIIRLLIDKGFDPNRKQHGTTPLHYAVFLKQLDCVKALIDSGKCNPYLVSRSGPGDNCTLCQAAKEGLDGIVKIIVEFKLDKKWATAAAVIAAENAYEEIALYLLDKLDQKQKKADEKYYPFHIVIPAARNNLTRIIDRMLEKEPRVLNLVGQGSTMLSSAAEANNIKLVKKLIRLGAQVFVPQRKLMGLDGENKINSNLHSYNGREILAYGTSSQSRPEYGSKQDAKLTAEALEMRIYGAFPSDPLAEAVVNRNLELVKLFVEAGCVASESYLSSSRNGVSYEQSSKLNAIELARLLGFSEIADYLGAG